MSLLTVHDVHRSYRGPAGDVPVLRGVSLQVPEGGVHAIMGPSGSGKSTLMHCLAGLDTATAGQVWLGDTELTRLRDEQLTTLRRERIGFVFQAPYLIPFLDVTDNVALLPMLAGRPNGEARTRARIPIGRAMDLVVGRSLEPAEPAAR